MSKIELLAPVASKEGLKAVINAGADAVYIGGMKFGARAYADNLSEEEMIEAIEYAHIYNVKVYMTVNVLLKQEEIANELYNYILPYYQAGLDGVIVQDVGVLAYLDKVFPDLEKHASTQMTLVSSECKELMARYNVSRIVPARELSLDEIKDIKQNTDLEIEVFIHGALCYSYSGQCLMSSMIGERSGNRGRCAQPCRKRYSAYDEEKIIARDEYLLSPKDLCGLYNLHNLINIGVDSLKIEGRMKKSEYAACVVSIYRKYIDLYYKLGHDKYIEYIKVHEDEMKEDIIHMQDMYNRGGYTKGYYDKHNGKELMSTKLPSHYGTYVGKVINVSKRSVAIKLVEDITPQDVLQIRDENYNNNNDNSYEFTTKDSICKGNVLTTNYSKGLRLGVGQKVYRIKNNVLIENIQNNYMNIDKKIDIDIYVYIHKDEPIKVGINIYDEYFEYEYDKPELSMNRPITSENIEKQFRKISNTNYKLNNLNVDVEDGLFIPVGKLNEIRRNALEEMKKAYVSKFYKNSLNLREIASNSITDAKDKDFTTQNNECYIKDNLGILVTDEKTLDYVLSYIIESNIKDNEIKRIYLELDMFSNIDMSINIVGKLNSFIDKNIDIYVALPRIVRKKSIVLLEDKYVELLNKDIFKGFLVRNIESVEFIKKHINRVVDIVADANMYITNEYAANGWKEYGVTKLTHSLELTREEIKKLSKRIKEMDSTINCEMVVYTTPIAMLSAGCVKKTKSLCNKKNELLKLKDKYNEIYHVRTVCEHCYNIIYNSKKINILDDADMIANSYRVELLSETKEEIYKILDSALDKGNIASEFKGHFYKETL